MGTFDVGRAALARPSPLLSLSDSPRSGTTAGAALIKPKAFYSHKIMPGQKSSPKAARDAKLSSLRGGAYFPQSRR